MAFYAEVPEVDSKFYKYMFRFDNDTYRRSVCTVKKVTRIKNAPSKYILQYVEEIDGLDPIKRTCTVFGDLGEKIIFTGNYAIVFFTKNFKDGKTRARRIVKSYLQEKIDILQEEIDGVSAKIDKLAKL